MKHVDCNMSGVVLVHPLYSFFSSTNRKFLELGTAKDGLNILSKTE